MRPVSSSSGKRPVTTTLDQETLYSLHRVLFGHEQREMPPAWHGGFAFREGGMACGLRQREGGPCGVYAAVQAHLLRELYAAAGDATVHPNATPRDAAADALVRALAHIIWSARVGRIANVVNCRAPTLPPLMSAAGELTATQCGSSTDVISTLRSCIGTYRSADGPGVALLLYSVALTRGIAMVGRDADFPAALIMGNGYCAQELVNLLLIGRAHSNVFDGEQRVGSSAESGVGGGDAEDGCRLRGIPRRAPVGFLTLFERQQYGDRDRDLITVGSHYKRPLAPVRMHAHRMRPRTSETHSHAPYQTRARALARATGCIWQVFVVQSESHYSVLWAADGQTPADIMEDGSDVLPGDPDPTSEGYEEPEEDERPPKLGHDESLDLYYFDQMAERDDAVRLTLRHRPGGYVEGGAPPPLEVVILSRWPGAQVDWNGEEVIL